LFIHGTESKSVLLIKFHLVLACYDSGSERIHANGLNKAVMNKARSDRAIYSRDYHFIKSYRVFYFHV